MRPLATQFAIHAPNLPGNLKQVLEQSRQLGVGGLEIPAVSPLLDITTLSTSGQREVRHLFAGHNQTIASTRVELGAKGFAVGEDVDKILDRLEKIMASSVAIGCPRLSIDLGRLPPAQRAIKPKPKIDSELAGLLIIPTAPKLDPTGPESTEPDHAPTAVDPAVLHHWFNAMSELGSIADRFGIVLAFSSVLSSIASLSQLIEHLRCPWFGFELNTANALSDEWPLDEIFNRMSRVLSTVRAKDAIKGESNRTKPAGIGTGDVAWPEVVNHLDQSNYAGRMILDATDLPNPPQSIATAIAYLSKLHV